MNNLEERINGIKEQQLSLEQIKRLVCETEAKLTELKFKKDIQYIRINKDGYESYFHKRKSDGFWYLINNNGW